MNNDGKTLFLVKAKDGYEKQKSDELDLSVGDIIEVKETEFDSWWVGKSQRTGLQGWFPSNFVEKTEVLSPTQPRPKKNFRKALVLNDYTAQEEDDLALQKGSVVEILEEFDSWYLGRIGANVGTFPSDFVQILSSEQLLKYQEMVKNSPRPKNKHSSTIDTIPTLPYRPQPQASNLPTYTPPSDSGDHTSHRLPQVPVSSYTGSPEVRSSIDIGSESRNAPDSQLPSAPAKSKSRLSRVFTSKKNKKNAAEPTPPKAHNITSHEILPPPMELSQSDTQSSKPASRPLPVPPPHLSPSPSLPIPPPHSSHSPSLPPPPSLPLPPPSPLSLQNPSSIPGRPKLDTPNSDSQMDDEEDSKMISPISGSHSKVIPSRKSEGMTRVSFESQAPRSDKPENRDSEHDTGTPSDIQPKDGKKLYGPPKLAKILEDYESSLPEELYLNAGDTVEIIHTGTNNDSRWKGDYHGRIGYFPSSVVEPIMDSGDVIGSTDTNDQNDNEPVNCDSNEEGEKVLDSGKPGNDETDASAAADKASMSSVPSGVSRKPTFGAQKGGIGGLFLGGDGLAAIRKMQLKSTTGNVSSPPTQETDDKDDTEPKAPIPESFKLNASKLSRRSTQTEESKSSSNVSNELAAKLARRLNASEHSGTSQLENEKSTQETTKSRTAPSLGADVALKAGISTPQPSKGRFARDSYIQLKEDEESHDVEAKDSNTHEEPKDIKTENQQSVEVAADGLATDIDAMSISSEIETNHGDIDDNKAQDTESMPPITKDFNEANRKNQAKASAVSQADINFKEADNDISVASLSSTPKPSEDNVTLDLEDSIDASHEAGANQTLEPTNVETSTTDIKAAEEGAHQEETQNAKDSNMTELAPARSPGLNTPKKALKRLARKKPTAETMAKNVDESQTKILETSLKTPQHSETSAEELLTRTSIESTEQKPHARGHAGPPRPEKPKNLVGGVPSPFAGAFKHSGRVGSATASRIAALQQKLNSSQSDTSTDMAPGNSPELANSLRPSLSPSSSIAYQHVSRQKPVEPSSDELQALRSYMDSKFSAIEVMVEAISANSGTTSLSNQPAAPGSSRSPGNLNIGTIQAQLTTLRAELEILAGTSKAHSEKLESFVPSGNAEIGKLWNSVNTLTDQFKSIQRSSFDTAEMIKASKRESEQMSNDLRLLRQKHENLEKSVSKLSETSKSSLSKPDVEKLIDSKLKQLEIATTAKINVLTEENKALKTKIEGLKNYIDELVVEE